MALPPQSLVDFQLKELVGKEIRSELDLEACVESASIDIPLHGKAYLVDKEFSSFNSEVSVLVDKYAVKDFDLQNPVDMYQNQVYMVKVLDLALPKHLSARFSPKSSTGRVDTFVKTLIDGHQQSDIVPAGSAGEVWLRIKPQKFNITVQEAVRMNQLRIFDQTTESMCRLDMDDVLAGTYDKVSNFRPEPGQLYLSLDVPQEGVAGYRARNTRRFIDFTKKGNLEPLDFFEPIKDVGLGELMLEKDSFYIMGTREKIRIRPHFSAEMQAIDTSLAELRVHYAGFFDPGFGDTEKNSGATGVLEIRTSEDTPVVHGRPICSLIFHENRDKPQKPYGSGHDSTSHYQGQTGPELAKFFKAT